MYMSSCISSQNRYLLFLTESYAALQTLQHFFEVNYQQSHELPSKSGATVTVDQQPPLIIFGSSFSKDRQITQVLKELLYIAQYNYNYLQYPRCTETSTQLKFVWKQEEQSFY